MEITAQLWIKGEFWNNPLNGEEVTFCIYGRKIYKFTTYNRAKIEKLNVTDIDIEIKISYK